MHSILYDDILCYRQIRIQWHLTSNLPKIKNCELLTLLFFTIAHFLNIEDVNCTKIASFEDMSPNSYA